MNCCRSIPPSEYSHAGAYRDGREAPRSDALGEKSGPIPPDMDLPWTMVREKQRAIPHRNRLSQRFWAGIRPGRGNFTILTSVAPFCFGFGRGIQIITCYRGRSSMKLTPQALQTLFDVSRWRFASGCIICRLCTWMVVAWGRARQKGSIVPLPRFSGRAIGRSRIGRVATEAIMTGTFSRPLHEYTIQSLLVD